SRAMEVAGVARGAGLICNVNGSVETGIGNLANLQLAAAASAVVLSCVVPVSTPAEAQTGQVAGIYYKDDLIAAPMHFLDGAIELPDGPGMGIAPVPGKIARYGVGRRAWGGGGRYAPGCDRGAGACHAGRRARRGNLDLAGELCLRHRLCVADAAADAVAPRHGAGHRREPGRARR